MPKIGKHFTRIHAADVEEQIEYFINYSTHYGFYALIPANFNEGFDLLSEEESKKLSAVELKAGKNKNGQVIGRGAVAESEGKLQKVFAELIQYLMAASVKKRPVIVVWHESETDLDRDQVKGEFKKVGTSLQFTYCQELRAGAAEPHYYLYYKSGFAGRNDLVRKEVRAEPSWRKNNVIVLDDTPHNRASLELIHRALKDLDNKMIQITKTPEAMLEFIQSKQILLTDGVIS